MLESILHVVLVLVSFAVIGLVLIQQGKGSDVGASFGAGASQTVFGSAGSGNFLTKATTWLGILFFTICFGLAYWSAHHAKEGTKFDFSAPAVPAAVVPPVNSDVPSIDAKVQTPPATSSGIPSAPATQKADAPAIAQPASVKEESGDKAPANK